MRYLLIACILCSDLTMARDYTYAIRQAQRACRVEQFSMLSDRNGTPSCQKVRDLLALQRLEIEAEVAKETGQPMPDHHTITIDNSSRSTLINPSLRLMYDPMAKQWCWSYQDGTHHRMEHISGATKPSPMST